MQSFSNCPHLGLSGDSGSVFMMATPSHCCFADDKVFSPDLEYQSEYCLTQNHRLCSLVTDAGNEQAGDFGFTHGEQPSAQAVTTPSENWQSQTFAAADGPGTPIEFSPDLFDGKEDDTAFVRIPDFVEAAHPASYSEADAAPPIADDTSDAGTPSSDFGGLSGIDNLGKAVGPQTTASMSDSTRTVHSATESTSTMGSTQALRQPIMMPPQEESINFWPLLVGFMALLGLLVLYAVFNPITGPTIGDGAETETAEVAVGTTLDLLSPREPTEDSAVGTNNGGTGQDGTGQDDTAAVVNQPPADAMQGVVATLDQPSTDNQDDGAATVPTGSEDTSATNGGASTGNSNGVEDNNNVGSTGIVVVTATPPPTINNAAGNDSAGNDSAGNDSVSNGPDVSPSANVEENPAASTSGSGGTSGSASTSVETTESGNTGGASRGGSGSTSPRTPTSTPQPGGKIVSIKPNFDNAGWWSSDDLERNHLGDSYLYVGRFEDREYVSAIRYDLRELSRGAEIYEGTIQLTGLRGDRFRPEAGGSWRIELISEDEFSGFSRANFLTARSAVASHLVGPTIGPEELGEDVTFTWTLTEQMRLWLKQQIIDGARSVIVRIQADLPGQETLFAWDTGQGPQSKGNAPWLVMSVGPAPETPPPFSTRPFIVASATPIPKNLLTVVAVNQEATTFAQTVGTYTPVPYDIYTPTPYPQNLATVQAAAIDRGLPPVALPTRPLSNPEERAANAQYATAVALTTGTFTPVPVNYVTPQLILPSPIALNVATTVARTAVAEAQAQSATPTPLPYNAIIAEYVIATTLPESPATADARRVIAQAMAQTTGTATPLPWHIVVVSPTPTPLPTLPPTITPTPFLFDADGFEPTPLPQPPGPEEIPDTVPGALRRKVLFKSDRVNGQVEILALDPNTGQTLVVNLPWVHDVARRSLSRAPDGQRDAIVTSADGQPAIRIVRYEGDEAREISGINVPGYDPAWSPNGGLIAFVSHASGGDEIYVMNEDGTNPRPLTNTPTFEVKHPTWFNGQIVFHSNQTGRRQLWIMNTSGGDARVLSASEANDFEPVYVQ